MANQTTWAFDPAHSELTFKVKHLMITNVKGAFKNFDVLFEAADDSFKNASATATIQVASISTNNEDRDNHLKSADFFDAEKFSRLQNWSV